MTPRRAALALVAALLCASGAAVAAPPAGPPSADRVLLISLDGFAAAWLGDERLRLPNLRKLAAAGVHGASRTITPSVTWPAHTTLVTGTLPVRHGVVGNHWLDRATGRKVHAWVPTKVDSVRVPTIYDVAKAAGLKTASMSWPQTNGAPTLDFEIPETYGARRFDRYVTPALRKELAAAGVAVERLATLAKVEEGPLDELVADASEHVMRRHGPELMLVHFTSADTFAHRQGVLSKAHRVGLELYDRLVGQLLGVLDDTGARKRTAVVVVSDHGFLETPKMVELAVLLARAGQRSPGVRVVTNGHAAWIYLAPELDRAAATEAIAAALKAHPMVERVVPAAELPSLGLPPPEDNPAAGDLLAICKPDCYFAEEGGSEVVLPSKYKATHGYPPDLPANHPVFVAAGAGIARREAPVSLRNVDVAPTVARLLGLQMPGELDGRVAEELLAP